MNLFNFVRIVRAVLTSETGFVQRFLTGEAGFASQFLASETGSVNQRAGLPVAWTVGVLVGAAALLGTPEAVKADPHYCGSIGGTSNCWYRCITVYGCPQYASCSDHCKCFCSDGTPTCDP